VVIDLLKQIPLRRTLTMLSSLPFFTVCTP